MPPKDRIVAARQGGFGNQPVLLTNTWALGILAILLGTATNLGLIGAQSYLLSWTQAVYTLYCTIAAGALFSLVLKCLPSLKCRLVNFYALAIALFCLALLVLMMDWVSGVTKAILWMLVAMFGFRLLRWMVAELAIQYLDPARANSYASYINAFFEGGTVVCIVVLKLSGIVLTPNQTLGAILVCCSLSLGLIMIQFFPKKNFEIIYTKASQEESPELAPPVRQLLWRFAAVTWAFGFVVSSEDYLVKVVLKDTLHSYEAIRVMTESYFAISCALIVLVGVSTGKFIQSKRLSPVRLLSAYAVLMTVVASLCLTSHYLYLFVAFDVLRRVCEYCLYGAGNQMIMGAFASSLRAKIRALHSLYYFVGSRAAMALVFSLTSKLPVATEILVVTVIVVCSSTASLITLSRFKESLIATLYDFVSAGGKSAAIMAAHTLSYLRPADYVRRMCDVLAKAPKKLLRKTIVLGLAYAPTRECIDAIEEQFYCDQEEIQIAAIDALRISGKMKATQFMLNILMEKARPKTKRVKMSAMAAIGALYGKRSIPFLLNGLEESDSRTVANALEILGNFKDDELKPYFLEFAKSKEPRIRANALIGLSHYRDHRVLFEKLVRKSFEKADVAMVRSLMFVIGKSREKAFHADIVKMYEVPRLRYDPRLANVFTWALIRLNDKRGFELANEIISAEDGSLHDPFMHYFSLHQPETRYDIIKQFVGTSNGDGEAIRRLGDLLKNSAYDFHEELQYLNLCTDAQSRLVKLATTPN